MIITAQYYLFLIIGLLLTTIIGFLDSKITNAVRNTLLTLLVINIAYLCYINFPVTLTLLVIATGLILLFDFIFLKKRRKPDEKPGTLVHNAKEFFPVLLIVWIVRSFIIQPYHVPTGSLEPTVMAGDFVVVKQYSYGLRFPIGNWRFFNTGEPKTGDIVLFYYPQDPTVVFVKRVIGLPGDHIQYKNKILTINGRVAKQTYIGPGEDIEPDNMSRPVNQFSEDLNGVKHMINIVPVGGETDDFDITVPAGHYFMMGDNRDNSDDSRSWGFVPEENLLGKAARVWMHWDSNHHRIGWDRIGKKIQ